MAISHNSIKPTEPGLPDAVYAIRGENDSLYLLDYFCLSDTVRVMRLAGSQGKRFPKTDGQWWHPDAVEMYDDNAHFLLEDTIRVGYRTNWVLKDVKEPGWFQTTCTSIQQLTAAEAKALLANAGKRP
nr:hypothetical protein [Propionibacterium sp.]